MALFGAAAVSKPAPVANDELTALRAEVAKQKDAARLRARHGPNLTDTQVDELLIAEADMVVRKAAAKEAEALNKENEIELDRKYRDLACELIKKGSMLVSVDGQRINSLTPDLLILCPVCGKPLSELSGRVYDFAKLWYWTNEEPGDRNRLETFTLYSARSPLTECGFVGHRQHACPYCKEPVRGIIQMVLI